MQAPCVDLGGRDETTEYAIARLVICRYSASRVAAGSSLESSRPSMRPRRPGGSMQAATTSGPAQAPRPASSAPATYSNPARARADS